jgi:hypothetical protein
MKQNMPDWKKQRLVIRIVLGAALAWLAVMFFSPAALVKPNAFLNPPPENSPDEVASQASTPENLTDDSSAPAVALGDSREPASIELDESAIQEIRMQMKTSLAEIFTAQKAYHIEKGRYSTDLLALQWTPPDADMKFKLGFVQAFSGETEQNENSRILDTDSFQTEKTQAGDVYSYSVTADGIRLADLVRYCQHGCSAEDENFEAIAAANLDSDATLEIWLMNSNKEVIQVTDDTKD